jgi:5-methylcytosine-specific restriction endonuclease McrBC regulatory subunit McrC
VCRIIQHGLAGFDPAAAGRGAFLLDLGQAFERYLAESLSDAFGARPAWSIEAHPGFALGPTILNPDLLLRRGGAPRVALDAKWKSAASDAADLHQILAYATLTGAPRVGLVYPGRTDARATAATPDGRVRVTRYRLRVVGPAADLAASVARLARDLRRH